MPQRNLILKRSATEIRILKVNLDNMALFGRNKTATPLGDVELVLADLDGVVYRGNAAIPQAVEQLNRVAESRRLAYVTNNASRRDVAVAEQLQSLGLQAEASDIVTSAQAAVTLVKQQVAPGATVFVVGGDGLVHELEKAGYVVTRSADDSPAAVVQGFAKDVGWEHLAEAAFALAERPGQDPLPWIATNTDWTLPLERGLAPGNGTLVSAIHTAVQRLPEFAGKPETPIFDAAFERFGTRNALMIGDRLDTDIRGARASGIASLFVLTGVDRPKQLVAASTDMQPDFIVTSLTELHEPYPETRMKRDGSFMVGTARVRMNQHVVEIMDRGDSKINLLRAGCAAIYASGLAIYGLVVPEELHQDHWS